MVDGRHIDQARHSIGQGAPKALVARTLGFSRRVLYDVLNARGAYAQSVLFDWFVTNFCRLFAMVGARGVGQLLAYGVAWGLLIVAVVWVR